MGALVGRGEKIKNEWKYETKAKLEAGDGTYPGDLKMVAIIKVFYSHDKWLPGTERIY